jgi:hypothetical protein
VGWHGFDRTQFSRFFCRFFSCWQHTGDVKQPEYTEGMQGLGNFKHLATAILQAPAKKKKRQTKKSASQKKPQKSDKD